MGSGKVFARYIFDGVRESHETHPKSQDSWQKFCQALGSTQMGEQRLVIHLQSKVRPQQVNWRSVHMPLWKPRLLLNLSIVLLSIGHGAWCIRDRLIFIVIVLLDYCSQSTWWGISWHNGITIWAIVSQDRRCCQDCFDSEQCCFLGCLPTPYRHSEVKVGLLETWYHLWDEGRIYPVDWPFPRKRLISRTFCDDFILMTALILDGSGLTPSPVTIWRRNETDGWEKRHLL